MIDKEKLMTEINNFYYDEVFDKNYSIAQVFASIMTIISSQPDKGEWIPCSERLPEENVPVNITWVNRRPPFYYRHVKDKPFTATAIFYKGIWHWWSEIVEEVLAEYGHHIPSEIDKDIDVIAWMPLPEPYKESED